MSYMRRSLVTGALVGNALRPPQRSTVAVPAMFAGWGTAELAPHLLAFTAADTIRELARPAPRRLAVAAAVASMLGLGRIILESMRAVDDAESVLEEALGSDYRRRLESLHDDLDAATRLSQFAWPFRMSNPLVERVANIPYEPQYGRRGLLDIYRARNGVNGAPVLLQIHGGGWTIGSKEQQGLALMNHMAAHGWVCVAINYRLSPRSKFPAHIEDVKRAIAWIREHGAEYGADPSFIAITGGSAGGHLAALAALTPNDPEYQPGFEHVDTTVQAAVPFYGVYDMAGHDGDPATIAMRDRFLVPQVFGRDARTELEHFERASPLHRINDDAPPFYVIHGVNDTLVSIRQARAFVHALRDVSKRPVAYSELPGTQHAFDVFISIRSAHIVRAVDRFLRWSYADYQNL